MKIGCIEMRSYSIRKYRKKDLENFIRFWTFQDGESKAKKRILDFKWLIEGNPFSEKKDDYFVIDENGKAIAYEGMMPYRFSLSGNDYDGYVYHDTMVDPDKRGQGLGKKIVKKLVDRNGVFSIAVWMNLPNAKLFEKCGWNAVSGLFPYVRIYDAATFIHIKSSLLHQLAVGIVNRVLFLRYKLEKVFINFSSDSYTISEIDQFDDRVDNLFHSVKKEYRYISYRTKDVLNWKYSHKAFSECSKLVCEEDDELKGYIVYRKKKLEEGVSKVTIFDFLCSPQRKDIFISLLKKAISEIEEIKPAYVEILSSNQIFDNVFKKLGFIRMKESKFALKFIHSDHIETSSNFANGDNWFFTYADGDRVFWDF